MPRLAKKRSAVLILNFHSISENCGTYHGTFIFLSHALASLNPGSELHWRSIRMDVEQPGDENSCGILQISTFAEKRRSSITKRSVLCLVDQNSWGYRSCTACNTGFSSLNHRPLDVFDAISCEDHFRRGNSFARNTLSSKQESQACYKPNSSCLSMPDDNSKDTPALTNCLSALKLFTHDLYRSELLKIKTTTNKSSDSPDGKEATISHLRLP